VKTILFLCSLLLAAHCSHAQGGAPIKATATMHPDGTRSTTVTDPEKRTTEETLLDASGKTIRRIVYPLDDRNQPRGAIVHDAKGKIVYKSKYLRDSADRIQEETIMSETGETIRRRVYTYGANNKVSGVDEYDANGVLIPRAVKPSPGRPDKKKKR
jgi:hypothetical protein